MKTFRITPDEPTELEQTEYWLDKLEKSPAVVFVGSGRAAMYSHFLSWANASAVRIENMLVLGAIRSRIQLVDGQHRYAFGAPPFLRKHTTAPSDGRPAESRSAISGNVDVPAQFASFTSAFEKAVKAHCSDPEERAEVMQYLEPFQQELRRALARKPDTDPAFWTSLYQRRRCEEDTFDAFLREPRRRVGLVLGTVGSGKSTFLSQQLSRAFHAQTLDPFYIDCGTLGQDIAAARAQTLSRYAGTRYGGNINSQTIEEITFARTEALIERRLATAIQSRLRARFRSLQTEPESSSSPARDFRVNCWVVAALKMAARRGPAPVPSDLQSQADEIAQQLANQGACDFETLLAREDISQNDGDLWRRTYAAWFTSSLPLLIIDNVDSCETDGVANAAIQAALHIAANISRARWKSPLWWKIVVAARDAAAIRPALASLPTGSYVSIGLGAPPEGDLADAATVYLPLASKAFRRIVATRLKTALDAFSEREGLRLDVPSTLRAILRRERSSPSNASCENIATALTRAFDASGPTLAQSVCSAYRRVHEPRKTDRPSLVRLAFHRVAAACGALSQRAAALTLVRLMDASELRIAAVAQEGQTWQSLAARRVLEDERLHGHWEAEHHRLMRSVADESRGAAQAAVLRRTAFALIHRKAMFDYLRKNQITGSDRHRIFALVSGDHDYATAVVKEHSNYLRATSSFVCSHHVGIELIHDRVFGEPLWRYEQLYADYFQAFCSSALSQYPAESAETLATLLPYLKRQLNDLRRAILRVPYEPDGDLVEQTLATRSAPSTVHAGFNTVPKRA